MSWRSISRQIRRILTPEAVVPFIVGALCLGVLSNAVFQLLTHWLGAAPGSLVLIIVGSLSILVIAALLTAHALSHYQSILGDPSKRRPEPRRGLIFLVSQNEAVFREALKPHEQTLERIWFVCSKQSLPLAEKLKEEQEYSGRVVEDLVVNDVHDPFAFFQQVKEICADLPEGWDPAEVIADYVGMTAHASVGTVLGCLFVGFPLQYTPGVYDDQLKAVRPLPSFEVEFRFVRPSSRSSSASGLRRDAAHAETSANVS
jgi:hypothetical protein